MAINLSSTEQEKITGLLNKFGVDYIATGDFAMRKYVDSKYFNNIQLWVKPTPENYQKLDDAFSSVRRKLNIDEKSFTSDNGESALLKLGRNRKGVEIFTSIPGLSNESFNQAFANRKVLNAGNVPVPILNEKDLHKSLQKSTYINQSTDVNLLERATKLTQSHNKPMAAIDWREASMKIDPHKLLTDMGFTHNPKKGLFSSRSQTYNRGEESITVYPNPSSKPFFIDNKSGKKGDSIDMLNWQYNYNAKDVNRYIKDHFNGLPPEQISRAVGKKKAYEPTPKIDDRSLIEMQSKDMKEKYGLKNNLTNPGYLEDRGLSLKTIFRPEFFRQVLNSLGWNSKSEKQVNIDNTVFPMRSDHGINTMIMRNKDFKGFPEAERRESVWLSNPPLALNRDINIKQGDKEVILPKGTEGTLIHNNNKPGNFIFYYQDPHKAGKELDYNKVDVSGKSLEVLTRSVSPLKVNRMVITENPIDAISFHQLSPPKPGEGRMYVGTGGQPSDKQLSYINQLVQRINPAQIVPANDNDKNGARFNINLMGAIQHPATDPKNQFLAKITETPGNKEKSLPGEYHLKIAGAKEPEQLEKIAQRITDAINRFNPKGQEVPARISYLNGSATSGSEATIVFPKNDKFINAAQKQIEKEINENVQGKAVKVVKPVNKDFNEDLNESKKSAIKINYNLGDVPMVNIKGTSKNLYQQISGLANNAFDALFGGVPGSLPRIENVEKSKDIKEKEVPGKLDGLKDLQKDKELPGSSKGLAKPPQEEKKVPAVLADVKGAYKEVKEIKELSKKDRSDEAMNPEKGPSKEHNKHRGPLTNFMADAKQDLKETMYRPSLYKESGLKEDVDNLKKGNFKAIANRQSQHGPEEERQPKTIKMGQGLNKGTGIPSDAMAAPQQPKNLENKSNFNNDVKTPPQKSFEKDGGKTKDLQQGKEISGSPKDMSKDKAISEKLSSDKYMVQDTGEKQKRTSGLRR